MSSIVIAGYALFCIIVFFLVNRLLRKKKTKMGEEQVPAVSKIEVSKVETEEKEIERKQESEISNVVELETGKQEEVKQEKEVPKKTNVYACRECERKSSCSCINSRHVRFYFKPNNH